MNQIDYSTYKVFARAIYESLKLFTAGESISRAVEDIPFGNMYLSFEINIKDNFDPCCDDEPNPDVSLEWVILTQSAGDVDALVELNEHKRELTADCIRDLIIEKSKNW